MALVLDGTNGVSGVDGTASNPAIEGTDSNTGVFFPAADTVAIGTGGTERLRVDTSGNVGIGTSSPSSYAKFASVGTSGSPQGFIGTTGNGWFFNTFDSSTGYLTYSASNVTAAGFGAASNIPLFFMTNNTERMRIDSSGNVGIGTSSPSNKLDVAGDVRINANAGSVSHIFNFNENGGEISLYNNTGTPGTLIDLSSGNTRTLHVLSTGDLQVGLGAANTTGVIQFMRAGFAEAMRIDASGFTQFSGNLVMPYQGAPTSKAGAATLSGAELITGILNTTGTTYTITLPTGTNIEGALTWAGNNVCLDWFVINTASGTITIGANGNTTLGSLTIATGTSAHFRIRRTAANTFTVYRL